MRSKLSFMLRVDDALRKESDLHICLARVDRAYYLGSDKVVENYWRTNIFNNKTTSKPIKWIKVVKKYGLKKSLKCGLISATLYLVVLIRGLFFISDTIKIFLFWLFILFNPYIYILINRQSENKKNY